MKRSGHQSGTAFKAVTGELYMLGKKERILLRAILAIALKSKAGREIIAEKHGKESLQIAKTQLHEMGAIWTVYRNDLISPERPELSISLMSFP